MKKYLTTLRESQRAALQQQEARVQQAHEQAAADIAAIKQAFADIRAARHLPRHDRAA